MKHSRHCSETEIQTIHTCISETGKTEDYIVTYYEVFRNIDRLLKQSDQPSIVAAIDGKSGSGKSTLGRILKEVYDCNVFHADDFFLRQEQRTNRRLDEAGGNLDYERLKSEILDQIEKQIEFSFHPYDCSSQSLKDSVEVIPKRLNIVEGSYSQHPYFGDVYDLRFFLNLEEEEQIRRIHDRNGEFMLKRFQAEWIPMENRYFEAFKIAEKSIRI